MPAITLGLAEVEERLRALRRRLNSVTAQHSAYLSSSAVILAITLLVTLALRASALAFRIATWGSAVLVLGVVAGCGLSLRRRWLNVSAAAHLADRRAQLTDRLATLVDLRLRPRPSRLAPVLVAQALALGARWQPQRIAPRRVPRSVFLLIASLLALGSTAFIARRAAPPPSSLAQVNGSTTDLLNTSASPKLPPIGTDSSAHNQAAGGATLQASEGAPPLGAPSRGESPDSGGTSLKMQGGQAGRGEQNGLEQPDSSLAALPDRLQDAIRRAFHAEAMDQPRQLAARSDTATGNPAAQRDEEHGDRDAPRRGASDAGKPDPQAQTSQKQSPQKGVGTGRQNQPGQSKGEQAAQGQDPNAPNQKFDGSSPAAGEGSSPAGLMDAKAESPAASGNAPKTFKLTITSFLRAMEQKGNPPPEPGKHASGSSAAGSGSSGQVTLSDRQLHDDALRKAEIPPEYEDIVRRVYSLRADQ